MLASGKGSKDVFLKYKLFLIKVLLEKNHQSFWKMKHSDFEGASKMTKYSLGLSSLAGWRQPGFNISNAISYPKYFFLFSCSTG